MKAYVGFSVLLLLLILGLAACVPTQAISTGDAPASTSPSEATSYASSTSTAPVEVGISTQPPPDENIPTEEPVSQMMVVKYLSPRHWRRPLHPV